MTEPVENQSGRYQKLVPMLQTLIEDMSGFEVADAAPDVTFMEIGLDSLTLTQLALALQREFRVDIAFRQLMEDVSSVGALARYLDAAMPPDALAQAEPPAAAPPPPQSAPAMPAPVSPLLAVAASPLSAPIAPVEAAPGTVEQLIAQQIQVMAMQLQVLGRAGTVSAPPTPSRPAPKAEKPAKPQAFGAGARIKTEKDDSLTAVQVENLQNFIRKYNARTGKSKAYTQAHRPHLADPRVVSSFNPLLKEMVYPIVVSRSSGSTLWDLDGNKYVDLTSGFGSNFFGFSPPFINKALAEQMERGVDIGPQTPLAGEVAQLITDFTGLDRVAFCNTGSEAVLGAMRLARTVRGRNLIAIFSGAYHGIFNEVIVRGTKKLRSMAAAPGIPPEAVQNVLVLDYDDPQSLQILRERADDLAAVMVEPVQSRRPDLQPGEFLRQLRQFTQQEGIAFIVDEVITGFRTHPGGAQAIFGVKADIATYGKVVGAGMPIGVIAGQSKFMDALDGGQWQFGDDSFPQVGVTYFAGTFVRHPLAMAAAKAALEFLKAGGPSIQRNLNLRTTNMVMALNDFFQQAEVGIEIKHFGSLFKVNYAPDLPFGELLFYWLRHKGIHIWDHRPCFLTLTHTDEDIAFVIDAFKQSIGEMQAAGFLPQPANTLATTAARPPVPGARLGKDPKGMPTWYIPDPDRPGKYMKMEEVS